MVHACPKSINHHGGTEGTEKSFCLSEDSDKQKDSALKPLLVELLLYHWQMLFPDAGLGGTGFKKKRAMDLIWEVLFVYRYLPINEKMNPPLRVLCVSVVNLILRKPRLLR